MRPNTLDFFAGRVRASFARSHTKGGIEMALSEKDREEIVEIIRQELANTVINEIERIRDMGRPAVDPAVIGQILVRRPGLDPSVLRPGGGVLRSGDNCCNGCD